MKTKLLHLICSIFLLIVSSRAYAQLLDSNYTTNSTETAIYFSALNAQSVSYNNDLGEIPATLDPFYFIEAGNPEVLDEMSTLEIHDPATAIVFAQTMIAIGAGFGFTEDQTLWCAHAAYFMQLARFNNAALFASFGLVYSGLSTDFFSANFIDFQLKMLMFNPITQFNQVFFIYGVMLAYGLGADKFKSGGGKTDITRLTAALVLGLNIYITSRLALMVYTNVLAHQSQTNKPDSGGEIKNDVSWGLINQNNILTLALVFGIFNSSN